MSLSSHHTSTVAVTEPIAVDEEGIPYDVSLGPPVFLLTPLTPLPGIGYDWLIGRSVKYVLSLFTNLLFN